MKGDAIYQELGLTEVLVVRVESRCKHKYDKERYTESAVGIGSDGVCYRVELHYTYPARVARIHVDRSQAKPRITQTEITREKYDEYVAEEKKRVAEKERKRLEPIRRRNWKRQPFVPMQVAKGRPRCEKCNELMALVKSKGRLFWGCASYPECSSYQSISEEHMEILNKYHSS
jgi:hypothetical protein